MQAFEIPSEEIVAWRRHIHQNPELSFKEFATSQYIVDELGKMAGIDAVERPTDTSVVAVIKGGKGPGKTLAIRADIDALPVAEANEVCYRSTVEGVSHACGHDGHAAMLLGTAKVLGAHKDRFAGAVKLCFQHAEETPPGGAVEMVAAGVLQGVDLSIGLHIVNDKAGLIRMIESEAATTSADIVIIKITGRGSHGSMPHASVDPIVVGSEIVLALHTIVSRNISPDHFAVVSPAVFKSGTVCNVIPHTAELQISCRTRNAEDRELVIERISTIAQNIAAANGAKVEVECQRGYEAVIQDLALVQKAKEILTQALGADHIATGKGLTASNDYGEFTKLVPSCYFTVGGGTAEEGFPYTNHHPQFNFDEKCLTAGTKAEVALVMGLLG